MKVLIAGGGIGGLAAGIALRQQGVAVQVFERTPVLSEVGAGISLWANAVRALEHLGLGAAIRRIGMPAEGGLRSMDGRVLSAPPAALARRIRDFCLVVHRAELQAMLIEALGQEQVTQGAQVVQLSQDAAGVAVDVSDGRRDCGDVLVGADGLRSVVRASLHGDASPEYAGYTAWRGVTMIDPVLLQAAETWGAGRRFGQVPLTSGRVYWFATANAPEGERSPSGERDALLRLFRGWHPPIERLIESTPEDRVLRNDIYDRAPLRRWGRGRITLLGDAAHPMTPNLGQGACQALEDAVVLARCLAGAPDVVPALRSYESQRLPRTAAIVRESRQLGRVAQWQHPLTVALRNLAVRLVPSRLQSSHLESIVGYDVCV